VLSPERLYAVEPFGRERPAGDPGRPPPGPLDREPPPVDEGLLLSERPLPLFFGVEAKDPVRAPVVRDAERRPEPGILHDPPVGRKEVPGKGEGAGGVAEAVVAGDGHDIPLLSPVEADPHLRPGADVERRRGEVENLPGRDEGERPFPLLCGDLLPDGPAVDLRKPRPEVGIGRDQPLRRLFHDPGIDLPVEREDDMHRRVVDPFEIDVEDVEGRCGMAERGGAHYTNCLSVSE